MASKKHGKIFDLEDLWKLKRIGAPTVSPDGKWACAAVASYDIDENRASSQLWLFATDGSSKRQLTHGKKDSGPAWSPDGRHIAFVSRRGEGKDSDEEAQLYLIDTAGGEARRVASIATGVESLRWLPDASAVAFISWVWPELKSNKAQARRYKEDKDSKVKAYVIEHNEYRYWDHWLPRGRVVHIHLAEIESGKVEDLFSGTRFYLPAQDPGESMFDFSPDSTKLAFTFDFVPDPRSPSSTDIVEMDIKSGKWHVLTEKTTLSCDHPRYSPDGKSLAFISVDYERAQTSQGRLHILDRAKGSMRGLTTKWDRGVNAPVSWTPDSKALVFTAEDGVVQPIFRIALDKDRPERIVVGPGAGGVASAPVLSANGQVIAFVRASIAHPPALFATGADGKHERALAGFDEAMLAKLAISKSTSVTIKGFAGEPVQAWIVTPPDFDPKKKWPLIQMIHGGPHTCWNDTWHWRWNLQLLAASGYVICAVNYHGSTGWGQKFVDSITGEWGKRELADVEAATDHMLATGYIDRERVVATGGSYGGYMVAFMNGNVPGERYKAYVCHAGCYDWVSMMGGDGPFWFGKQLGAFPWDDPERVHMQSPHHYAKNFHTPTLVMHGELDYRVPYYQGLAYYNTLRVKNVPARLVFFPDENHWILKPQNHMLWHKEFVAWCDRYTTKPKKQSKKPAQKKKRALA